MREEFEVIRKFSYKRNDDEYDWLFGSNLHVGSVRNLTYQIKTSEIRTNIIGYVTVGNMEASFV